MNISVFGLGYVGAVSLGCLTRDGHYVIGVDVDAIKLDLLRAGDAPIVEAGVQTLVKEALCKDRLRVTDDAHDAVRSSDVSFVCVGTPTGPNGDHDLSAIERLSEQIGRALASKPDHHLVVVRSTVLPGTVESLIVPTIELHSGKRAGEHFDVCFQPEFLREGTSVHDYDNPPYTVVGTDSERAANIVRDLFRHLPSEFFVTTIRSAEMLKYACNLFHVVKLTFANEVGRLSKPLGVDPHVVMDLVCRDRQLNISPAYMKPGFAFGGSCLPKDLMAMLYAAKHNDIVVPMVSGIMPSNQVHLEQAIDTVLASGKRAIGILGLSFKSGTDDLRESPLVAIAERFLGKGLALRIYDYEVNLARLIGANRRFIERTIPHLAALMTSEREAVVDWADVVVVGQSDKDTVRTLTHRLRDSQLVLDLANVPQKEKLRGTYHGVCW